MALNVKSVANCSFITISAKSYVNGTSGTIEVLDYPNQAVLYTGTITFAGANGSGQLNINVNTTFGYTHGLFIVRLIENGTEQIRKPVLNHCDIDCCLAKLTKELLDCACDCAKCSTVLAKAQKIFLLLDAANTGISVLNQSNAYATGGHLLDIYEKYSKAKELCDASCGCDC